MKLRFFLAATLVLAFNSSAFAQTGDAIASTPTVRVGLPEGSATISAIKKRGMLLVGNKFGFQTFNYQTPGGRNEGYMADLARAMAKRLLGDENLVEFRRTTDATRFEMLASKQIDMIIDLTPSSEEKLQYADFSDEIFRSGSGLLVSKGSSIKGVQDLRRGTRVLFVTENKDIDVLRAKAPEATYIGYPDSKQAFAALKAGQGDAFTQVVTHLYRAASQDSNYQVISRFTDKPYFIAFSKGDTVLRDHLNQQLRQIKASGELDQLFQKWFVPYGGNAAR